VLAVLVGVSLILLTAYFGESPDSPLHEVQRGIVEVISPIQQGASTVLSPVKDVAGWFSDTLKAKSEADRLRTQNQRLTRLLDYYEQQATLTSQLRAEIRLDDTNSINSYQPVAASVIGRDPTLWYQTFTINVGADNGVALNDPVLGDGALVGKVTTLDSTVSVVTLITDHTFGAAAEVLDGTGDFGLLVPQLGSPNSLLLQELPASAPIVQGDQVVTAGFRDGDLNDLYPPGIPIGTVSSASQSQLLTNHEVQVAPDANLRHLSTVQVLTRPRNSNVRAQVSGP